MRNIEFFFKYRRRQNCIVFCINSKNTGHIINESSREGGFKVAKVSGKTHTQSQLNHHSAQKNPTSSAYRANMNNRANQCNPNHSASKSFNK